MAAHVRSQQAHGMSLRRGQLQCRWPRSTPVPLLFSAHCDFVEPACSGGSMAAQVHSPEAPHRTRTDETSNNNNNNNNNNNTKKEQNADVHLAPALPHAPMRDAVRAVARSFGIQISWGAD